MKHKQCVTRSSKCTCSKTKLAKHPTGLWPLLDYAKEDQWRIRKLISMTRGWLAELVKKSEEEYHPVAMMLAECIMVV